MLCNSGFSNGPNPFLDSLRCFCFNLKRYHTSFYHAYNIHNLGTVKNNMVSYYTDLEKNAGEGEIDVPRTAAVVVVTCTMLNMLLTLIFINVYLRVKHSNAINIAERSTIRPKENFISFRKLFIIFIGVLGIVYFSYYVHTIDFFNDTNKVPPGTWITNFCTIIFSMVFLARKKELSSFIQRRFGNFVQQQNRIEPQRTLAG